MKKYEFSIRFIPCALSTGCPMVEEARANMEAKQDVLHFLNKVGQEGWYPSAYQPPLVQDDGEIVLQREITAK